MTDEQAMRDVFYKRAYSGNEFGGEKVMGFQDFQDAVTEFIASRADAVSAPVVTVVHESWCDSVIGAPCDCNPEPVAAPVGVSPVGASREAFNAAMKAKGFNVNLDPEGNYVSRDTGMAWEGYQITAAQPTAPVAFVTDAEIFVLVAEALGNPLLAEDLSQGFDVHTEAEDWIKFARALLAKVGAA